MNKKGILSIAIKFIIVCLAIYIVLVCYFWERILPNTWVNGEYCTGKSYDDLRDELNQQYPLPETLIIHGFTSAFDTEPVAETYPISDVSLSISFSEQLNPFINNQSAWGWISSLFHSTSFEVQPKYVISDRKLEYLLEESPLIQYGDSEAEYRIILDDDKGYALLDGLDNRLDKDKAIAYIRDQILLGNCDISLVDGGCYRSIGIGEKQQKTQKKWENIKQFLAQGPSYDFEEEQVQISELQMSLFLKKDTDGLPKEIGDHVLVLNEEAVENYVHMLADQYDTVDRQWAFSATNGKNVDVKGGTYGGLIDRKKEIDWLLQYLQKVINHETILASDKIRVPEYTKKPYYRGKKSVGSTYIEVDMSEQKLYYYDKGNLSLESDIVTGNMKLNRDTPEGVSFVYGKAKNRILRGPGYATFVKYWMPVVGNIGLHDANWRKEFGGDIYLTAGSHGCVNLPTDIAKSLYENVELGVPVVMFY